MYYARAIDCTMLPTLAQIAATQANPTEKTRKAIQILLDYAHNYSQIFVRFYQSDMILTVDSDAAYYVLPKARSRYAGYFRLLNTPSNKNQHMYNGPLLIECKTLRHMVSSAAEAETNGVFHNAKLAVSLRNILKLMGHPQPSTTIYTDNTTTTGFANNNMQMKRSKSWDINLHWLRDRGIREQCLIKWEKGSSNKVDYFTKHHTINHHKISCPKYVRDTNNLLRSQLNTIYEQDTHKTTRMC